MDTSSKPALLIRQGALLVSMPPLHAIITPDACLLFPGAWRARVTEGERQRC
jgi:hypothetical protein